MALLQGIHVWVIKKTEEVRLQSSPGAPLYSYGQKKHNFHRELKLHTVRKAIILLSIKPFYIQKCKACKAYNIYSQRRVRFLREQSLYREDVLVNVHRSQRSSLNSQLTRNLPEKVHIMSLDKNLKPWLNE